MAFIRTATGIVTGTAPLWLYKLLERAPLGRTMKIGPEDRLAIAFADQVRSMSLTGQLKGCWTHIPHEVGGGTKNAGLRYALAKAMGLVPGSGDYVFTRAGGSLWLEAKRPKTDASDVGRLNPAQRLFHQWCDAEDVPCVIFTTVQEGLDALADHGFIERMRYVGIG